MRGNLEELYRQAFRRTYNKEPSFTELTQFKKNLPYGALSRAEEGYEDEYDDTKPKKVNILEDEEIDPGDNFTLFEGTEEV